MAIGGPRRTGNIGRAGKRIGAIGKATTCVGSSLVVDQDRVKTLYPTTTTAAPTTTTTG